LQTGFLGLNLWLCGKTTAVGVTPEVMISRSVRRKEEEVGIRRVDKLGLEETGLIWETWKVG